jgi:protein-L-isoaspartate(D-aspartate) O-methyltransferase
VRRRPGRQSARQPPPTAQVDVLRGDGWTHDPGEVDAIIVFAGSTHPAPVWLDRLIPGGELLMPLTVENWMGFLLGVTVRFA